MASARKKNGRWYYRITIMVGDGKKKYIERGSYPTYYETKDRYSRDIINKMFDN